MFNMPIIFKNPDLSQAPDLTGFLQGLGLITSDLPADLSGFTLAYEGEQIVGSAGMELKGEIGLLRSVAVAETHRNQQLGQQLFTAALDHAKTKGVQEVYLITNTAEGYFAQNGFRRVERSEVPAEISRTEQFSSLCPSASTVMKINLK